jgi:hypothetical protein
MNSFPKGKKIYDEDIFKDIMNTSNSKKNIKENSDNNFWDIYLSDEDELSNNLNLSGFSKKNNNFNNNIKCKIKSIYNQISKPTKRKINNKYKVKLSQEKKQKKNNSVDINMNKQKTKMKTMKIDELSVFRRNDKWLKTKNDNINKAKEKLINKKEKEIKKYRMHKFKARPKPTELNNYNNFNVENNVKYKPENLNFFIRLNKLREEKMRTPSNIHEGKINLLKISHYSGIQDRNITPREMDKCMKYIHDKLKGKK